MCEHSTVHHSVSTAVTSVSAASLTLTAANFAECTAFQLCYCWHVWATRPVHAAVLLHTARMLLLPQENSVLAVGTANMHGNALALKLLW